MTCSKCTVSPDVILMARFWMAAEIMATMMVLSLYKDLFICRRRKPSIINSHNDGGCCTMRWRRQILGKGGSKLGYFRKAGWEGCQRKEGDVETEWMSQPEGFTDWAGWGWLAIVLGRAMSHRNNQWSEAGAWFNGYLSVSYYYSCSCPFVCSASLVCSLSLWVYVCVCRVFELPYNCVIQVSLVREIKLGFGSVVVNMMTSTGKNRSNLLWKGGIVCSFQASMYRPRQHASLDQTWPNQCTVPVLYACHIIWSLLGILLLNAIETKILF